MVGGLTSYTGGGGGTYTTTDDTDDVETTTTSLDGIADSGPTWEDEDDGGFGDGTSEVGGTDDSDDDASIPWTGAEPDDTTESTDSTDSADSTDSDDSTGGLNDGTDQDVDDIQNAGDSTDGSTGGFGDGTSRSGDNSGSGGESGPGVEDSRGSDDVSPDVPPDEVEAPGDDGTEQGTGTSGTEGVGEKVKLAAAALAVAGAIGLGGD